jgi:hypothetical protein
VFLKVFHEIGRKGKLPNSTYEAKISMILKPDKDTAKRRKLQTHVPDEH